MIGERNLVVAACAEFPDLTHLTLGEVATVGRWRQRYTDSDILACAHFSIETPAHLVNLRGAIFGSGIAPERLTDFLRRNPRPLFGAA